MNLRFRFIVLYVLLAGMASYMSFHRDLIVPLARPLSEFPSAHADWRMVEQSFLSESVIKILMPTDYLSRRYVAGDGAKVDVYISYFDGSPDSGGIHSPKHCMPGSGWTELSSQRITMKIGEETVKMVRAVYAMSEIREVIYYWFTARGVTISDEFSLKLADITGSIFYKRRDQSFIRISAQTEGSNLKSEIQIEHFIRNFYPIINNFLPM